MTLANCLGMLSEEDRLTPPKPLTNSGRVLYVGFGTLLIVLGIMGKVNL
jgi:hypothetical protein